MRRLNCLPRLHSANWVLRTHLELHEGALRRRAGTWVSPYRRRRRRASLSGILNYGTPSQRGVSVYIKEPGQGLGHCTRDWHIPALCLNGMEKTWTLMWRHKTRNMCFLPEMKVVFFFCLFSSSRSWFVLSELRTPPNAQNKPSPMFCVCSLVLFSFHAIYFPWFFVWKLILNSLCVNIYFFFHSNSQLLPVYLSRATVGELDNLLARITAFLPLCFGMCIKMTSRCSCYYNRYCVENKWKFNGLFMDKY